MASSGDLFDSFSHWSFAPDYSPAEFSFALQDERSFPQAPLWRLDLSPNPQAASEQLAQMDAQLTRTRAALQAIPERIQDLVAGLQESGPVSFDLAAKNLPAPEHELLRWLECFKADGVSFGTETLSDGELYASTQGSRQATQNLLRALTHLAWIETQQGGQLFARTSVNWTGDQTTAWKRGVTPQQLALHQHSMRLAIASRLAWLRLLIVVIQGATRISVLVATPGASWLALPAVWKFANNVILASR